MNRNAKVRAGVCPSLSLAIFVSMFTEAAVPGAAQGLLPLLPPPMVGTTDSPQQRGYEVGQKGGATPYPSVLLYEKFGNADSSLMGYDIDGGGDVNGDGVRDFIVGAPYESPNGVPFAGSAYVYSGLNGSQLFRVDGSDSADVLGASVAILGDVNGDGRAEFLVGAPYADPGAQIDAGSVYVYSGLNASLLQQKDGSAAGDNFGQDVARAGTINADANPDYLVGAPYADSGSLLDAGVAYVFSGSGGGLLYRKYGKGAGDYFGTSVAGGGDINADGREDFIVGAPYADSALTGVGAAYVYSGLSGTVLYTVHGDSSGDRMGNSIDKAGDVDGNGTTDFIVGAPGRFGSTGASYLYSGTDGLLIRRFDGSDTLSYFGFAVAGAGDVNGDGFNDVIISAPGTDPTGFLSQCGALFIYSGKDWSQLHQSFGASYQATYGFRVAGLGDLTGDGKSEFATGAPLGGNSLTQVSLEGRAYVLAWGAFEEITELADIGNDQGKQMRIRWSHEPPHDGFIQEFAIYRRIDGGLSAKRYDPYNLKSLPPGEWDFVASVPARGENVYSAVVPTLRDSTIADGMWWTAFFVSGIGENPVDHFDSPIDSGYSLDNLAPAPPINLMAAQTGSDVDLDWKSSTAADFDYYWVYRDTLPGFTLSPSKRIGSTSDTTFLDNNVPAASGVHYRVSAVDFSGNEGLPSNEATTSVCACNCAADPQCDGVTDVFDVVNAVNVAFRNASPISDPNASCPFKSTDVDCNNLTDIFDVIHMVNVAFRDANPNVEFCTPCP